MRIQSQLGLRRGPALHLDLTFPGGDFRDGFDAGGRFEVALEIPLILVIRPVGGQLDRLIRDIDQVQAHAMARLAIAGVGGDLKPEAQPLVFRTRLR